MKVCFLPLLTTAPFCALAFVVTDGSTTRTQSPDIILLCYDVWNSRRFARLHSKWLPELGEHVTDTPVILVGLREDTREGLAAWEGVPVDISDGDQVRDQEQ